MFYSPDPSPVDPENQDLGLAVVYAPRSKTGRWQYSQQGYSNMHDGKACERLHSVCLIRDTVIKDSQYVHMAF